jgi:hypothetical protein
LHARLVPIATDSLGVEKIKHIALVNVDGHSPVSRTDFCSSVGSFF